MKCLISICSILVGLSMIGQVYALDSDFPGNALFELDGMQSFESSPVPLDESYFSVTDEFNAEEFDWFLTELAMFSAAPAPAGSPPFIMLAGYMDTDISYQDGGTLNMLAYVTDPDSAIASVEIYYAGMPTGVFLNDNGFSGDFGAGDGLWGLLLEIAPYTVPAGEYLLELRAMDTEGNLSDLWPYLTIH